MGGFWRGLLSRLGGVVEGADFVSGGVEGEEGGSFLNSWIVMGVWGHWYID
jgi:hypothetical protein